MAQEVTLAVGQFILIIVLAQEKNFVATGWAAWNGSLHVTPTGTSVVFY
jgi:hypothetical protein